MHSVFRREIAPGVRLTCVPSEKFKAGVFTVNLVTGLHKNTAALNAALPRILRRGTSDSPDMEAIAARLDLLYGAKIEPIAYKLGERQLAGFISVFADDAFIPEKDVLERVISFVGEMLLSPATAGGRLRAEYVEGERDKLIDEIRSVVNDKRRYADMRLVERMCEGEAYAVPSLGTESEAAKISVFTATRQYRELVSSAELELFYCGSAPGERVERAVNEAFSALPRMKLSPLPETKIFTEPKSPEVRLFTETLDVVQGKLSIGCRLGDAMNAPDYAALAVMNGIFGGCVTSKLFKNVREKMSLCYYASSRIDRHKGVMIISSGIDAANYEKAVDAISCQLDAVKNGDFTEDELESVKRELINAYKSSDDSIYALAGWYTDYAQLGADYTPDDMAALVSLVTKDDVIKAAAGIRTDAIYFLKGGDDVED